MKDKRNENIVNAVALDEAALEKVTGGEIEAGRERKGKKTRTPGNLTYPRNPPSGNLSDVDVQACIH